MPAPDLLIMQVCGVHQHLQPTSSSTERILAGRYAARCLLSAVGSVLDVLFSAAALAKVLGGGSIFLEFYGASIKHSLECRVQGA